VLTVTAVACGLPGAVGGWLSTGVRGSTKSVTESAGNVCVKPASAAPLGIRTTGWSGARVMAARSAAPYR
jgi:hypothetical protein